MSFYAYSCAKLDNYQYGKIWDIGYAQRKVRKTNMVFYAYSCAKLNNNQYGKIQDIGYAKRKVSKKEHVVL